MPRTPDTSPQTLKVFGALLDDPQGWHYGYALSKVTGLASGTLYPILMRLVDRDLLEARWEPSETPGRPPRHTYRLTPDGTALATARIAAAEALRPASGRLGLGGLGLERSGSGRFGRGLLGLGRFGLGGFGLRRSGLGRSGLGRSGLGRSGLGLGGVR